MLSQAHPITNLFETMTTEPMNYIQVVHDLMLQPSMPPENYDTIYEEIYPNRFTESTMILDLNKINEASINRYKSAFHKLGEFVVNKKTEVVFPGLKEALKVHTKTICCSWSCLHQPSPKRELLQLLTAIKSQSKPTRQRYVIKVVNG